MKQYQESHEIIKEVNEIIVQASLNTGACYGVPKCVEIVFEHGKMVRGEGLPVLEERMKTMDPDENEIYKFLGIEHADERRKTCLNESKIKLRKEQQCLLKQS